METYNNNQSKLSGNINFFSSQLVKSVCLVLLVLFVFLIYRSSSTTISTISVTGTADITAKPDTASFVVTFVNSTTDVAQGINVGELSINKLVDIAKELGGSDIEIKKTFYQITPQTSGYTIANAFSVKTSKIENLDNLIKKLYTNSATTVSNVTFESSDIKNVESKLRQDVFKDAQEKAARIAQSANKSLGKVISITDDSTTNTSTIKDLSTNDGLINITKSISVVYQLK
jgi:uncharacterized protein